MKIIKNPKTEYRLYQSKSKSINSSIFDLVSGDYETNQTKGLSYILKTYPGLIKNFLLIPSIKEKINKEHENVNKIICSRIVVDAEKMIDKPDTHSKYRADILIRFYNDYNPILAIVIEAKSVNVSNKHIESIETQLKEYLKQKELAQFENKTIGCILTRDPLVSEKFICITWGDIINKVLLPHLAVNNEHFLVQDFYNFITNINKNMEFYEKEVASVAAGESGDLINKYYIYSCPAKERIKHPIFFTYRVYDNEIKKGGVMNCLYKVKHLLMFDPHSLLNDDSYIESFNMLNEDEKNRLVKYVSEYGFGEKERLTNFYIFDKKDKIELGHKPHPHRNNQGVRYYTLSELLSGKEEVETASQILD